MNKLFVINPISGGLQSRLSRRIVKDAVSGMSGVEVVLTEHAGHAHEIAEEAVRCGMETVVAVGGDGTVNEVASALVGTKTVLGIIPIGSGNGLARHLHIPLLPLEAIKIICRNSPFAIDSAVMNGSPFFCTAGVGFDAQVAADYADASSRGLFTYVREAVGDWVGYSPEEYVIETEEGTVCTRALLITCGNANQWGNGFYITPEASLQDGKLDVAVVKPSSFHSNLKMLHQLRGKSLDKNPDVEFLRSSFVRIERSSEGPAHFDGEKTMLGKTITLECIPSSLLVIPGEDNQIRI